MPIPYCSLDQPYTFSAATSCTNSGKIFITDYNTYKNYYNFSLYDIAGTQLLNSTYLNTITGAYETLPSNWYRLVAIPITSDLRDTCEFKWIEIEQTSIQIAITAITLTNAICGSFDSQKGRAIIGFSGLTGNYFGAIYDINGNLILFFDQDDGIPIILENLKSGNYYGYVWDTSAPTCRKSFSFQIIEETIYSVPNIKEIYIWGYDEKTNPVFWSTANDPDYYGGLDTLKFQSTKIKEFDFYIEAPFIFYIPVDEANVNFTQTLQKVRQGMLFNNVLTIAYAVYDETHWRIISTLRDNKWTIVFKDNNDNWWTFGYEQGAEANGYIFSTEDGGIKLTFSENSKNKIITSLDENFINNLINN